MRSTIARSGPIRPDRDCSNSSGRVPEQGLGEGAFAFGELLQNSRAQNGRFFGYVMGSAEPVACLETSSRPR